MTPLLSALFAASGRAFALVFRAIKIVRPKRPIHNHGVSLRGTLDRDGGGDSGISWVDSAGKDDVVARFSRSAGLPGNFPDILGLAVRAPGEKPAAFSLEMRVAQTLHITHDAPLETFEVFPR